MHPLRISLYVVIVLMTMLGLMYFSNPHPLEDGHSQDGFHFRNNIIKYPTYATFFRDASLSKEQKQAIEDIVHNIEDLVESEIMPEEIPDYTKIDSTKIQRISYPGSAGEFLTKLQAQLNSGNCHIIHYGDSQIEGDRMSAYIRNRLQSMYGGGGPGFIPIKQEYHQLSAEVTPSENWIRYAAFDPTKPLLQNKNYGAYLSVSRFTAPYNPEDTIPPIREITRATIDIRPSQRSYAKLRDITAVGLHYGNVQHPVSVQVYHEGVLIKDSKLKKEGLYHNLEISIPEGVKHLQFVFEGEVSPEFYGLTLTNKTGISLDNVAMRGSSGTVFGRLDRESFDGMYKNLDPKIIIFQYGGNTVPYLKDSLAVRNYVGYLKNHVNWVRRSAPEASVLFIGPSDMATMINGELKSYALLPYLDEELKKGCLENNVAYWSLFNAMGGENSLRYWFDQGLMGNDYVHLTPAGTRIVSELFFTALHMDLKNMK